jgi:type I restriction enzyme, R subunit
MSTERDTQNRIIGLFREQLGYRYLGNWADRANNRQIEAELLSAWLKKRGVDAARITRVLEIVSREANNQNRSLYDNNKKFYSLLYYGVDVKTSQAENTDTVALIDWANPQANDFAIAEEVTLRPELANAHTRRPDLVLYINGIAVVVIELKRGSVSIGEGIRQLISNQKNKFNEWFFSTVQLLIAGNNSEGLRYAPIDTPESYFLKWKEDEADDSTYQLDKYLIKLCSKARLLELMHDFVLFDAGQKKLPRAHQYFGIKAAQARVKARQGGIIWHSQGSGKSIVMVLLAKWILANHPTARVLIVTDRDELDKQIEDVFMNADREIVRSGSRNALMRQLGEPQTRLLCTLVHKFRHDIEDTSQAAFEASIAAIKQAPSPSVGDFFVFVDECHRTQSGRMHQFMKALMPNSVLIGFTGTPLLKSDAKTSTDVFGSNIHVYNFEEAVQDGVVLDLQYEARDIEQELTSQDKVDAWFESRTRGLNDWQKATLREHWGTMQKVLSSRSRMDRVVTDIIFDFGKHPRLATGRGNAILVAGSIYEACRYFELFQKTQFKDCCAVVTSYVPNAKAESQEDIGANTETDKLFVHRLYTELLKNVTPESGKSKTESYEDAAKKRFKKEPQFMRLLIVVDKLLTGFDAPSCTCLYIDKAMQDHGLFQAICRTNRLDGDDKKFGCIVDYKDLLHKVNGAIGVYTQELAPGANNEDTQIFMRSRLETGKTRLDQAREAFALSIEPIQPPKEDLQIIRYFCGNPEIEADLKAREAVRMSFYKSAATLLRSYAAVAGELVDAGYSAAEAKLIEAEIQRASEMREIVRRAAEETLDVKPFEADMRFLIDSYIRAEDSTQISSFGDKGLLEIIRKVGMQAAINSLPSSTRKNTDAVAETIANNVRSKIIKAHLRDPAFYDRMSKLLTEILADLRERRVEYQTFLSRLADLVNQVEAGADHDVPQVLRNNEGLRAIYNLLGTLSFGVAEPKLDYGTGATIDPQMALAQQIATQMTAQAPSQWRGVDTKERLVKGLLHDLLGTEQHVEAVFGLLKARADF